MKKIIYLFTILLSVCVLNVYASSASMTTKPDWQTWVKQLKQEAVSQGIRPDLFDQVFQGVTPDRRVLHFDNTQPEKRITFLDYRKSRIDAYRIKLGVSNYKKNQALLNTVGQRYGVNPCFIVALWGIESSYGHYKGDFPVIKSLATLAYDDRRGEAFRKELLIALHILNDGHVSISDFKGEWAGASGHPQFLPSSWQKYAVDYDGDGRRDIWNDYSDVFASIANYLRTNGWETGQPWSIQVSLPGNFPSDLINSKITKSVSSWEQFGVKSSYGFIMPDENLQASIIQPLGGPAFMVFKNFRVLLTYNNSNFYAGSVGYLADQICLSMHRVTPGFAFNQGATEFTEKR